ncbi:unnamed protein product [Medioppia subpectinata]|uniref:Elongation of very long chain fatty acids protein n=1 Tax=Medioppia subpectinata TaxID=1979941 RepID=A0A7R9PTM1_9ACAR|nr:unnamed protein product [Medioppia subpectinata]CAG2100581.1 unnamed protein product [Medioppia subpectinata]
MAHTMTNSSTSSTLRFALYDYWLDFPDPRTKHYPVVGMSPLTFGLIMASYVWFVTSIGPKLMKNREPFQLRSVMLVYNTAMVAINTYFFAMVVVHCDYGKRFLDFKYPDRNDWSARTLWELSMGWWYLMSKFLDLFDTVLFVLRKKQSHITFLHLYHHTCVPVFGWMFLKHNGVMPATGLFGLINSFIHILMYSYYALSTLGPEVRPYLWWKKYITQAQLAQFAFGIVYGIVMLFLQTGYPVFWFYFGLTQPFFFFYLFYDFYRNSYFNKTKLN